MTKSPQIPPEDMDSWLEAGRLAELGLFAGTVVHELKQPLFAIKAMLQLLLVQGETTTPEDLTTRLKVILSQAEQMERILQGYGNMVQRPGDWSQPYVLNDQVSAACETLRYRARQLGVELVIGLDTGLPVLRGNPVATQQAVVNVLQNALDAATLAKQPEVQISTERADDGLVVLVRDNGAGISELDMPRVFQPFFTTKPPGAGTGLGLTITRELLARCGGKAELENTSRGLAVRIILPLQD